MADPALGNKRTLAAEKLVPKSGAELDIFFKTGREVELHLSQNCRVIDTLPVWPADPNLVHKAGIDFHFDTVLVTSVDKILKRNKIDSVSLEKVFVGGNPDFSSLAYEVAQAVASALKR